MVVGIEPEGGLATVIVEDHGQTPKQSPTTDTTDALMGRGRHMEVDNDRAPRAATVILELVRPERLNTLIDAV